MKYLAPLILLGIVSCTLTKKTSVVTDVKLESLTDSIADVYASSILIEDLNRDLSVLASDEYEGRETARPGQKKAAKYISDRFNEIGVSAGAGNGSFLQTFAVDAKNASNLHLLLNGVKLTLIEDFYYIGNLKDTVLSEKELVFVVMELKKESILTIKVLT